MSANRPTDPKSLIGFNNRLFALEVRVTNLENAGAEDELTKPSNFKLWRFVVIGLLLLISLIYAVVYCG